MDRKAFLEALAPHAARLDVEQVERAYAFSDRAHAGQKRLSGEPFVSHGAEIAGILLDLNLVDTSTLVAALLHDVVEDTATPLESVEEEFGPDVGRLVDGLT